MTRGCGHGSGQCTAVCKAGRPAGLPEEAGVEGEEGPGWAGEFAALTARA